MVGKRKGVPAALLAVFFALWSAMLGDSAAAAPERPTFTVATVNIGIGPGMVPLSRARTAAVARAIAAEPFDVMCIQEAWTPEVRAAIKAATGVPDAQFVHVDTTGQNRTGRDWCEAGQIDMAMGCAERECGGVAPEDIAQCTLKQCKAELMATYFLKSGCVYCLGATIGRPFGEVRDICTKAPGMTQVFDGANGVVLLSRLPLRNVKAVPLKSTMSNRVAIFATVRPRGTSQEVEIGCMHASTKLALPAPTSGYVTWDAEKAGQIAEVVRTLESRAGRGPAIIAGDMNTGPDGPAWALDAKPFDQLLGAGYGMPEPWLRQPFCTMCPDMTLRDKKQVPRIVDLVMLKQSRTWPVLRPVRSERFFTQKVTVIGNDGKPVLTDLSDHYGNRVTYEVTAK